MMRKTAFLIGLCAVASASIVHAEIDLRDYDDELMRALDKTIKYFEPDIAAGNAQGAIEDAEILLDGFKYTEAYFTKKGNAEDAVKISQQGQDFIDAALKSVAANDFETAAEAARGAARTCRACHDIYKPKNK